MVNRIRYKLFLSFIGIALLSFPFNIYFINNFNNISKNFLFLNDYQLPRLQALLEMKNTVLRANLFISNFEYILKQTKGNESTPTQLGAAKDQLLSYLEEIGNWQKIYLQHLLPSEQPTLAINQLTQLKNEVILKALNVFSGKENKLNQTDLIQSRSELEKAQANLEHFINQQISAEGANLEQIKHNTTKAWYLLKMLAIAASILMLLAACFIAYILSRWIAMPIISLRNFTHEINQDNLDIRTPVLTKDEIGDLAISINTMLQNLSQAKTDIIEASRLAGVAEVATNIIHNVGNILNSVNVSVSLIMEKMNQSKINLLPELFEIINTNKNNLVAFLNNDERGKLVLPYFQEVLQILEQERLAIKKELNYLQGNLSEIKQVITIQLSSDATLGMIESFNISELIEKALSLQDIKIRQYHIEVICNYIPSTFCSVKSKLIQILVNLVKNAVEALIESQTPKKQLIINAESLEDNFFRICVEDNGIGVLKENLDQIFTFGFTTKANGHGYGLHSCALLAIELGGKLSVTSEGLEKGTKFILEVPNLNNHILMNHEYSDHNETSFGCTQS